VYKTTKQTNNIKNRVFLWPCFFLKCRGPSLFLLLLSSLSHHRNRNGSVVRRRNKDNSTMVLYILYLVRWYIITSRCPADVFCFPHRYPAHKAWTYEIPERWAPDIIIYYYGFERFQLLGIYIVALLVSN